MTVCIAARCEFRGSPFVIAASDRMITSQDIEYEQPTPNKVFSLGAHTVACIFGSISLQSSIAVATQARVLKEGLKTVEAIADVYALEYEWGVRGMREARFLRPLGLNTRLFIEQEKQMSPALVERLSAQLQEFDLSDGGAVIVGADASGGHVFYVSRPGIAHRMDWPGFVAGGIGQQHAESLFMFERFTPQWDFARTLYLVYSAKRRAEVAPGVGRATDFVLVTTSPPNIFVHSDDSPLIKGVARVYERVTQANRRRQDKAYADVEALIDELLDQQAPAKQLPEGSTPELTAEVIHEVDAKGEQA